MRRSERWRRYGLDDGMIERLIDDGACWVCGGVEVDGRPLSIDHDHATGIIRGALCHRCNRAIGLLNDDAARIRAAADYLDAVLDRYADCCPRCSRDLDDPMEAYDVHRPYRFCPGHSPSTLVGFYVCGRCHARWGCEWHIALIAMAP